MKGRGNKQPQIIVRGCTERTAAGDLEEIYGDQGWLGMEPSFCQENETGLEVIYSAWLGSGYEAIAGAKQT